MDRRRSSCFSAVGAALALHPLDDCSGARRPGNASSLFFGPNVKQHFLASLPGAVIAVAFWIGFSYLLGTYFRHLGKFNKTYGTLGAAITLMIWFYWTGFALLVGAELAKVSSEGKLEQKQEREP